MKMPFDTEYDRIRKLRWLVFKIWYFTLVIIIISFGYRATNPAVLPPFADIIKSASLVLGLVIPPLGVILAFYTRFDASKDRIVNLSEEFFSVTIWCSFLYHSIFWICVVYGVALNGFDRTPDGDSLYRNSTIVVHIMGLFVVLLGPATWLFGGAQIQNAEPGRSDKLPDRPNQDAE